MYVCLKIWLLSLYKNSKSQNLNECTSWVSLLSVLTFTYKYNCIIFHIHSSQCNIVITSTIKHAHEKL